MSKIDYHIRKIDKKTCKELLDKYHYLSEISKGFKSGENYGLFHLERCVGVCIFTGFPVPELVKGMFGLDRADQKGFFELSRLCLHPLNQTNEHNLIGWFAARCIKDLVKNNVVRAILSYADNDFHKGTVYRALGFDYYGLTDAKKDFWIENSDGSYSKHSRGKIGGVTGEWRPRSRKHRFVKIFDKSLCIKWEMPL